MMDNHYEAGRIYALEQLQAGRQPKRIAANAQTTRRKYKAPGPDDYGSAEWHYYTGIIAGAYDRTPSEQAYYDSFGLYGLGAAAHRMERNTGRSKHSRRG